MLSPSQHPNFKGLQINDDIIDLTNSPRTNTTTTDSETDQPQEQKQEQPTNKEQLLNQFLFDPDVCEVCMEQNELEKYLFVNKRIAVRQIDDDSLNGKETDTAATNGNDNEDSEAAYAVIIKNKNRTHLFSIYEVIMFIGQ